MFDDRTQEAIKKEALAEINPDTGLSFMAGSFADAVIGPAARQVSEFYKALPAVVSMLFVDPTSGRFLDLVGGDYHNLVRREGTRATCSMDLFGKAGTVIPRETMFLQRWRRQSSGRMAEPCASWRPSRRALPTTSRRE